MSGTNRVAFGEIVQLSNGANFTKADFGEGLKIIGVSDFGDRVVPDWARLSEVRDTAVTSERQLLKKGDIVFVRSNGNRLLVGRNLRVDSETTATHSAFTIRARPDESRVDSKFLAYQMRHLHLVGAMNGASGTNITNLNQTILGGIGVWLPSLRTQRRVADILGTIDDLIENNRRRVEVLEEMARAVYREWFVHFRFPGHEDATFVDSDLGPIPDGWEWTRLIDVADITMGQSPKSEFYNDDGVGLPFHQGVTNFGAHYPTHLKFCTVSNRLAQAGDVLVSVRAPVGRLNLADRELVIGRGVAAVTSQTGHQALLMGALQVVFAEEDSMGGGTIFKAITKKELQEVRVPRVPGTLAAEADSQLSAYRASIRALTFSTRRLAAIRDLLLPKLVTGQIDLSDLDLDAVVEKAGV